MGNTHLDNKQSQELTAEQIEQRRDQALRHALQTPPKPHEDMKFGKRQPETAASPSTRAT